MARTMAPDAGEMADGSAGVRSTLCARVAFAVGAIGVEETEDAAELKEGRCGAQGREGRCGAQGRKTTPAWTTRQQMVCARTHLV